MVITFLTTLAAQIGSACYNNYKGKKHAEDIARKQQIFEEKVTREGIANARAEFAELCALQREIEKKMQYDRLDLINTNYNNSILIAAYEKSLGTWPLMVPPYVIKNDIVLSLNQSESKTIPLNCILTTSTDSKFNKAIFYKMEEILSCFCSKYWNVSAKKSIRFFQEAWRDNFRDVGSKHKDLYSHLSDVPTLVISPVIKNKKLIFRFYWWGLSPNPSDAHLNDTANELDPEVDAQFTSGMNYDNELVESVLSVCIPKLEAFISFFADMYYWNFYSDNFLLPKLIENNILRLPHEDKVNYCQEYSKLICEYVDKKRFQLVDDSIIIENVNSITSIDNNSSVLTAVFEKILNINSFLDADDVVLIKSLEVYCKNSQQKMSLKGLEKYLEKKETISIYPCADESEIYYYITQLLKANNDGKKLFIRFLCQNAFIAAIANDNNDLVFGNRTSRFHLFVFQDKTMNHNEDSFVFMIGTAKMVNIDEKTNPVYNLSVKYESLATQINNTLLFLNEANKMYETVSPAIKEQNYHYSKTNLVETITEADIIDWIKSNYKEGNEFVLTISYDKQNKVYVYFGFFCDNDNVYDNVVFLTVSSYLDRNIYKRIKNKCKYKFKIQR